MLKGKALCSIYGEELPGARLVTLYVPEAPATYWRKRGVRAAEEQAETSKAREQAKQEADLSVALRLVRPKALWRQIVKAGAPTGSRSKRSSPLCWAT